MKASRDKYRYFKWVTHEDATWRLTKGTKEVEILKGVNKGRLCHWTLKHFREYIRMGQIQECDSKGKAIPRFP